MRPLAVAVALGLSVPPVPSALAEEPPAPRPLTEPRVRPTALWLVTQLLPSPEVAVVAGTVAGGMRWQITPFLFSFGIHRGLSPVRFFVAEPLVRHSGSIELYFSPEWVGVGGPFEREWFYRSGLRSYVPVLEKGEALSLSLGSAAVVRGDELGVALEGGAFSLSGSFGLLVAYAPTRAFDMTTVTLAVRYF